MKWRRRIIQLLFFSLFLILLLKTKYPLDGKIPVEIFLGLSPLTGVTALFYSRTILLVFLPGLFLLLVTVFFGRFFCRLICPLGTILDGVDKLLGPARTFFGGGKKGQSPEATRVLPPKQRRKRRNRHQIKYYLLIFLLVSSFFTLEFVGLFDPLALLHRTFILVLFHRINLLILGVFILILFLGLAERRFWCNNLCPAGALFALAARLNFLKERKPAPLNLSRRYFLGSLGLGLGSLVFLRLTPFRKKDSRLIRPPGALPENEFSALCIRCCECVKVCPTKGLEPTISEAGVEGFWTPRLVPRKGQCVQYCVSCGQVCPTGAIRKLTVAAKSRLKMGRAVIDRKRCLSWNEGKLCLICVEYCPYLAVKAMEKKPFVIEDLCRGCGLCEKVCPVKPEAAIIVYALHETIEAQSILSAGDKK